MADEPPPGTDLVWVETTRRIEAQLRQADALDTKAGILVGIHAIAAGLLASISTDLLGAGRIVAAVVVVGLVTSGWFAFRAFRTQDYDAGPRPDELWRFGSWQERQIRVRFLSTRFQVIDSNQEKLKRKAVALGRSLLIVAMVALFVAATMIVHLLS